MIFVVLGTQKFQLNRLLKLIDDLIEKRKVVEPVFAQIGNSSYVPKNYEYTKFMDKEDFEEKVEACDILISHSGVGTIITGLKNEKPVIVYPRLEKYGEHVDDHQLEIGESFSANNFVYLCKDNDDLASLIENCKSHKFNEYVSERKKMVNTIRNFLETI